MAILRPGHYQASTQYRRPASSCLTYFCALASGIGALWVLSRLEAIFDLCDLCKIQLRILSGNFILRLVTTSEINRILYQVGVELHENDSGSVKCIYWAGTGRPLHAAGTIGKYVMQHPPSRHRAGRKQSSLDRPTSVPRIIGM